MQDIAPPLANGRYRLMKVLGAGGMATVYLAWDERLKVYRAIKVLSAEMSAHAALRQRFHSEAQTMATLRHASITTVHDVDADGTRLYMVMELLEGGSLMDRIDRDGALGPRSACDLMCDVLAALQVAHDKGVVHRDVKPHNVMLTADGLAKVTDFGIAHLADGSGALTRTGATLGTWAYMAPEQRAGARDVDARADVYAAGASLYTLVTGRQPVDIFNPELHSKMFADLHPALRDVIIRATRYQPEDRHPSAEHLAAALREIMELLPDDADHLAPLVSQEVVADSNPGLAPEPSLNTEVAPFSGTSPGASHATLAPGGQATAPQTFALPDLPPATPPDNTVLQANSQVTLAGSPPPKSRAGVIGLAVGAGGLVIGLGAAILSIAAVAVAVVVLGRGEQAEPTRRTEQPEQPEQAEAPSNTEAAAVDDDANPDATAPDPARSNAAAAPKAASSTGEEPPVEAEPEAGDDRSLVAAATTPPSGPEIPPELVDPSSDVRIAALVAREPVPEATAEIVYVLTHDTHPDVKRKAWRVLRARWRRGTGSSSDHEAAAVWMAERGDTKERIEAIEALGEHGSKVENAALQLGASEAKVRIAASKATCEVARRTGRQNTARALITAQVEQETDSGVREAMLADLADL